MKVTAWNITRSATAFAAAAMLLTSVGCGRPDVVSMAHRAPTALTQAYAETGDTEQNEPGFTAPKEDLGHFFKVDENVYRGQQPTDQGLEKLKAMGVKTVVYLHFSKRTAAHEKAVVEGLGMTFKHIPMSWITPPKDSQVEEWLRLTADPASLPLFVHCQHGKDRTGTMVGIYRIQHDGWKFDQAYTEMKERGFRTFLIGLTYGVKKFANRKEGIAPPPQPKGLPLEASIF